MFHKDSNKCGHNLIFALLLLIAASVVISALASLGTYKLSVIASHDWKAKDTWHKGGVDFTAKSAIGGFASGEKVDYQAKYQAMADMTFEEYKEMMDEKVLYFQEQADATQAKITQENFEEWKKSYLEKNFTKKDWHWKK